jgi:cysteinyl-tRNA synthetase
MKLYNTLSHLVEEFQPREAGKVGLYACGPTVYDYTHLGHLRKYVMDDVLVRVLRQSGYSVQFVRNITDVGHLSSDGDTGEDKLEKGAKKYNQSVWDIARRFEEYFVHSMEEMGNLPPDVSCRATEHITEQLAMVLELEKKGHTYVIEGDGVYFDTSTFPEYGAMAQLRLDKQQAGISLEIVEGKRNPSDFVLWKFERPGENRAMSWPSPWAERSFPGWHIECSAMAMKYLGEQFDIHTGGIDHVPVHHTNEIAQAEAATGKKPFVKYWVHHNFLQIEGEKMSKSLGNFFTIDNIVERGYSPMAFRLLLLGTHYRSEMNFTWDALTGTQKAWEKLVTKVQGLSAVSAKEATPAPAQLAAVAQTYRQRFFDHLHNDLATPEAVAVLWEVVKLPTVNTEGAAQLTNVEKQQLITEFLAVLGLDLTKNTQTSQPSEAAFPEDVQALISQRETARQTKDWAAADALRSQIEKLGYEVKDTAQGQHIKKGLLK